MNGKEMGLWLVVVFLSLFLSHPDFCNCFFGHNHLNHLAQILRDSLFLIGFIRACLRRKKAESC